MEAELERAFESASNIQSDRLLALTNAILGEVRYCLAKLITSDSEALGLEKLNLLKKANENFNRMLGRLFEAGKREKNNQLLCEDLSHWLERGR